jgi:hypothetical protein
MFLCLQIFISLNIWGMKLMFITYGVIRISMLHLYQGIFWDMFSAKKKKGL